MDLTSLGPLAQSGIAIACLILAVRWLAQQFTAAQREMVDMLRGVIAENSHLLSEVRDRIRDCPKPNKPVLHAEPKDQRP